MMSYWRRTSEKRHSRAATPEDWHSERVRNEERKSRLVALVSEAREAVSRRLASHTDKSSPAVWAAVRALRNFISSRQEGGQSGQTGESREKVPEKVVRAVRQLTRFLSEDESLSQEEEEGSLQEIQTFMRSEGAEEPDVFLPNIEIKKLPQKQSDSETLGNDR